MIYLDCIFFSDRGSSVKNCTGFMLLPYLHVKSGGCTYPRTSLQRQRRMTNWRCHMQHQLHISEVRTLTPIRSPCTLYMYAIEWCSCISPFNLKILTLSIASIQRVLLAIAQLYVKLAAGLSCAAAAAGWNSCFRRQRTRRLCLCFLSTARLFRGKILTTSCTSDQIWPNQSHSPRFDDRKRRALWLGSHD